MAYGSDEKLAKFAEEFGYDLPTNVASLTVLRNRGSAYIDSLYGDLFKGAPKTPDQPDQWPRTGVVVKRQEYPDTDVPLAVEHASYYAAIAEATGTSLSAVIDLNRKEIKREKVEGAVEREYFQGATTADAATPVLTIVAGMLRPFLRIDNELDYRSVGFRVV